MRQEPLWHFAGTFRSYQQRILDRPQLLSDSKLHIVAAPGSGKTILGLEVAGRLGQQTLVLSPSLAIRDQWLERLQQHFVPQLTPQQMSTRLSAPTLITSATYQGLFAAFTRGIDEESGENYQTLDILNEFSNVGTIILDEAHHLRTQWHRALSEFISQLHQHNPWIHFVALTATPPYESTPAEWARYIDLCGEIDDEISIPELVGTKDLCPHQDFVYINEPTDDELAQLRQLRQKNTAVIDKVRDNPELLAQLSQSELLRRPEEYFDECLDDERGSMGFLLLLEQWQIPTPRNLHILIDDAAEEASVEDGFAFMLRHPHLFDPTAYEAIEAELRAERLVRGGKLINSSELEVNAIIMRSAGKLASIGKIAAHEAKTMGNALRMLVLVDHIRAEYLSAVGTAEPLLLLGAVPAFEAIRRALAENEQTGAGQSMAMLTGSCVLVSREVAGLLQAEYACASVDLPNSAEFVKVTFSGGSKQAVKAITQAVQRGKITILVGTASLLGEGWDCPTLNTLVLGSTIKATMMSNQMRGRVIRVDFENPNKVANIWHLGTADPSKFLNPKSPVDDVLSSTDMRKLSQRFQTFVGPHHKKPTIESGIERCLYADFSALEDPKQENSEQKKNELRFKIPYARVHNEGTLSASANREYIRDMWNRALSENRAGGWSLSQQLGVQPQPHSARIFGAAEGLIASALGILVYFGLNLMSRTEGIPRLEWIGLAVMLVWGAIGVWLWWHQDVLLKAQQRIQRQSIAVFHALLETGQISCEQAMVSVSEGGNQGCEIQLIGASDAEQRLFINAVSELNAVVRNPRYILLPDVMGLGWKAFFAQNVPRVLSANKEQVDILIRHMRANGVRVKAVYVRSEEGRKRLREARSQAANNWGASNRERKQVLSATTIYGTKR